MALDEIQFDVAFKTSELTQQGNLFYVERLNFEFNTRGAVVTPVLSFENSDVTLPTISSTERDVVEVAVNRLGPVSFLKLSPVSNIQWFRADMFIRPVQLGLLLLNQQSRSSMPGRSVDNTSGVRFEVNPFSLPEDARFVNPVYRRLYVDIETGTETVTPVLEFDDGTEQTLTPGIVHATRAIAEFALCTVKRVKAIRLDGDFSSADVVLYDLEADINVPNARTRAVG